MTPDHHQVPRVRIKRVPGTAKTETGTSRENGAVFAPGTETSLEPLKHTLFGELFVGARREGYIIIIYKASAPETRKRLKRETPTSENGGLPKMLATPPPPPYYQVKKLR